MPRQHMADERVAEPQPVGQGAAGVQADVGHNSLPTGFHLYATSAVTVQAGSALLVGTAASSTPSVLPARMVSSGMIAAQVNWPRDASGPDRAPRPSRDPRAAPGDPSGGSRRPVAIEEDASHQRQGNRAEVPAVGAGGGIVAADLDGAWRDRCDPLDHPARALAWVAHDDEVPDPQPSRHSRHQHPVARREGGGHALSLYPHPGEEKRWGGGKCGGGGQRRPAGPVRLGLGSPSHAGLVGPSWAGPIRSCARKDEPALESAAPRAALGAKRGSMQFLSKLCELADRIAPPRVAHAHCDLPCGVYDPAQARVEAESVKAIMEKYATSDDPYFKERAIIIKEERAAEVNKHLDVLWYQYFQPAHLDNYPQLHDLFWKAKKSTSQAKRSNDVAIAQGLLDSIAEIDRIFWETKKA